MSLRPGTASPSETAPLFVVLFGGVFSLFAWVSPNHTLPWPSFHSELSMALCGFLVGGWVLWRTRHDPVLVPWLALAVMAFSAIQPLQWAFGLTAFFGDAWLVSLYAFGLALVQFIGFRAMRVWGLAAVLEPCAWFIAAGSLLCVYMQLYQWQDLGYLEWAVASIAFAKRPFANLGQPNHLATLLVLGLLAVGMLFDRRRFSVWVALALAALLALGLAMTESRAGLLEVGVGAALLLLRRGRLTGRLNVTHTVGAGLLVVAMVLSWHEVRSVSPIDAVGRAATEMATQGSRPVHWATMIDAIGRKPWVGYGVYGVSQAQYITAPDHPASFETIAHSHNLVLDLLVWNGLPIGGLATLALAWWFWAAFIRVPDSQAVLALASVVAVFVHAMLEFPLYYSYFLLPVGVLMGAVSGAAMPRAALRVPGWTMPVAVAAVGLATGLTVVDYFHLESDVQRSSFAHAHIGKGWNDRDYTRLRVLTHFNHFWNFVAEPERRGMTASQLDEMRDVVLRFPSDADIVRYASALALNGRPEEARSALTRICKTGPVQACQSAQSLWTALGKREVEIGRVPWPADSD